MIIILTIKLELINQVKILFSLNLNEISYFLIFFYVPRFTHDLQNFIHTYFKAQYITTLSKFGLIIKFLINCSITQ